VPGDYCWLYQRIAQLFPGPESSLERTYPVDSQVLQLARRPGAGCFVGSSAVEDDVAILGEHVGADDQIVGQDTQGARQRPRIGNGIERMAQV
jgi:hypothetical protein